MRSDKPCPTKREQNCSLDSDDALCVQRDHLVRTSSSGHQNVLGYVGGPIEGVDGLSARSFFRHRPKIALLQWKVLGVSECTEYLAS
jgi:hypothetical protein